MPPVKPKPSSRRSPLRFEPPTVDEAIFAAPRLADDLEGQTQIVSMLMGLPKDEIRAAILKAAPATRAPTRPSLSPRSVSG